MMKLFSSALLPRILRFRKEVVLLWRAFRAPQTPLWLKLATLFVVFYLVNPFDLIPEVLPVIGILDDLILVPLMVSWIVSRLPAEAGRPGPQPGPGPRKGGDSEVIDGTWRRL